MRMSEDISKKYRLPKTLNEFQLSMYIHLITWKWKYITTEPGKHGNRLYDALLPDEFAQKHFPLYRPIVDEVINKHHFKKHKYFGHMASSQAACVNLFVPLLKNPKIANSVLCHINPNFASLATDELEGGFQFEYWDTRNPLNDHTDVAGTDSDVAIAYYNSKNELCLWLIEHKLTEAEFTTCGGYRSRGNKKKENCRNVAAILKDHDLCYYQNKCCYKYWYIMDNSNLYKSDALAAESKCPFIGGANQLWRNQLMGYQLQKDGKFKHVHFSVIHHPENLELSKTIKSYSNLLQDTSVFSSFSFKEIIDAVRLLEDKEIRTWEKWYTEIYKIN